MVRNWSCTVLTESFTFSHDKVGMESDQAGHNEIIGNRTPSHSLLEVDRILTGEIWKRMIMLPEFHVSIYTRQQQSQRVSTMQSCCYISIANNRSRAVGKSLVIVYISAGESLSQKELEKEPASVLEVVDIHTYETSAANLSCLDSSQYTCGETVGEMDQGGRGTHCEISADCNPQLKCVDGECVGWDNGQNCTTNDDCLLPKRCVFDKCRNDGTCENDDDCHLDQFCQKNQCKDKFPNKTGRNLLIALAAVILLGILIHGACVLRGYLRRRQRNYWVAQPSPPVQTELQAPSLEQPEAPEQIDAHQSTQWCIIS